MSLARQAERRGHRVWVVVNSRWACARDWQAELQHGGRLWVIDHRLNREETAQQVLHVWQQAAAKVLVVDVFPRGLAGELAELLPRLSCPKVLIHRDLNPNYIARFHLDQFVSHYDLLLLPGEPAPWSHLPTACHTPAWLLRDHDELLPPATARKWLNLTSSAALGVAASGRPEEMRELAQLAQQLASHFAGRLQVRLFSPLCKTASPRPLLEFLPALDALVGSGGYNTVQEARQTCTPLFSFPRRRLYDRQAHRLLPCETMLNTTALLSQLTAWLETPPPGPSRIPAYINGAKWAVEKIEGLWR